MGILSTVSTVCGSVITILTLCCTLIKPLRAKIVSYIIKCSNSDELSKKIDNLTEIVIKNQEDNKKQSAALLSSLRSELLALYTRYKNVDELSIYEKENLISLYKSYVDLGGNSFIHTCMDELGITLDK